MSNILVFIFGIFNSLLSLPKWFYIHMSIISILFYTLLFGDSDFHEDGIVGKFHMFITFHFWNYLGKAIEMIFGKRISSAISYLKDYIFFKQNPIIQIFYCILFFGSVFLFVENAWIPYFFTPLVHPIHRVLIPFGIVIAFTSFLLASYDNPGVITSQNIDMYLKLYPCDGIIYLPRLCETCNQLKPGRSKHCKILNKCVAKYDHYCPWLANTVGERTYRWFLLFLVSNSTLFYYAATLFTFMLLKLTTVVQLCDGDRCFMYQPKSWVQVLRLCLYKELRLTLLTVFLFAMGTSVGLFYLYHLYLIFKGTTTNEGFKRKDWARFYKEWLSEQKDLAIRRKKSLAAHLKSVEDETVECYSPASLIKNVASSSNTQQKIQNRNKNNKKMAEKTKTAPKQPFGKSRSSATHSNSAPHAAPKPNVEPPPEPEEQWERDIVGLFQTAQALGGVKYFSVNKYDFGFFKNFYDSWIPLSITKIHRTDPKVPKWFLKELKK